MWQLDALRTINAEGRWEDPDRPPRAMGMVLYLPKAALPARSEVLAAAALSSVLVCLADEPGWEADLRAWYGAKIRKIARRARTPGQWEKAQEVPGVTVQVGEALVRSYVPTVVSEVDPRVGKLQIQGTDVPADEPVGQQWPMIVVNADLGMSIGKAAAQVGHAAMLWAAAQEEETVARWLRAPACSIREWPWERIAAAGPEVVVQDAGFTEVAPGSLTAAVVPVPPQHGADGACATSVVVNPK